MHGLHGRGLQRTAPERAARCPALGNRSLDSAAASQLALSSQNGQLAGQTFWDASGLIDMQLLSSHRQTAILMLKSGALRVAQLEICVHKKLCWRLICPQLLDEHNALDPLPRDASLVGTGDSHQRTCISSCEDRHSCCLCCSSSNSASMEDAFSVPAPPTLP